jgi:hypothetical protein
MRTEANAHPNSDSQLPRIALHIDLFVNQNEIKVKPVYTWINLYRLSSRARATGWMARVRFPAWQYFSLLHSIQTGSGGPPIFLSNGYRGLFAPGVKRPEREADHSSSSSAKDKNGGALPPLPIRLHGTVLS